MPEAQLPQRARIEKQIMDMLIPYDGIIGFFSGFLGLTIIRQYSSNPVAVERHRMEFLDGCSWWFRCHRYRPSFELSGQTPDSQKAQSTDEAAQESEESEQSARKKIIPLELKTQFRPEHEKEEPENTQQD